MAWLAAGLAVSEVREVKCIDFEEILTRTLTFGRLGLYHTACAMKLKISQTIGTALRTGRRFSGPLLASLLLVGCATFSPQPHDEVGFKARATSKTEKEVTISAVALGPEEAQAAFGLPVIDRGIQPVWVKVTNARKERLYLLPLSFDPLYFTPSEAAFINHTWLDEDANAEIDALFREHAFPIRVEGESSVEGFLYVPPDLGAKALNFVYAGAGSAITAHFVVAAPGLESPTVDFASLYDPSEVQYLETWAELRAAIETLPCCVSDESGEIEADPLNFVFVSDPGVGFAALIGGGWDQAEVVTSASAWKTAMSFLFGSAYRYSPVSDLYVFGRPQDGAFQITREDIDQRNHLRVWLTPLRFQGRPVWIGAISRDIGVILSGFGTTHKIDPDVDAERWYLAQSIMRAQALKRFSFAKGGPVSTWDNPRSSVEPKNIFYSDGLRIVMEMSREPVPLDEVEFLDWELVERKGAPE
ncbi:MAG: LssY C-terminal domain-containing protein [Pseudomonadota bacterium]